MKARVTTTGGPTPRRCGECGSSLPGTINVVRHWQLYVDDRFIADTSIEADGARFEAIAAALNAAEAVTTNSE